jgi:rhodanese-related sulfurtransferase
MIDEALPFETTPTEVKRRIADGERLFLIDVREPHEYQTARIDGSELVPMNTVPAALGDLESKADEGVLVVICHHGIRSANVVNWLRGQGVASSQSLAGGIDRWSLEVDPSVPRY